MGQSLVDFIREALATLSDIWERANDFAAPYWQIFVGAVLLMPVVGIILFAVFFTAAIPTFGVMTLALVIYFLVLRFRYPLVYTAVALESGRKVMLGILFLIAAECFLLHVLAAIGTLARGEGLNDFALSMFVAFGIITFLLLSIGVKTEREKSLKRMMQWTVSLTVTALILLAFPPVREEFPLFKNAIGEKIAVVMRWFRGAGSNNTPPPLSQAGGGDTQSAPRFSVSQVAGVAEGVQPAASLPPVVRDTTIRVDGDSVVTSVMFDTTHYLEMENDIPVEVVWVDKVGNAHYDPVDAGGGIISLAYMKMAKLPQPVVLKGRGAEVKLRVMEK